MVNTPWSNNDDVRDGEKTHNDKCFCGTGKTIIQAEDEIFLSDGLCDLPKLMNSWFELFNVLRELKI